MTSGATLIAVIAAIASVIAGIGGPWLVYRAARSGQSATREIEQQKVEQSQAESWRQDAILLRQQMKDERAEAEAELKRAEARLRHDCDGKVAMLREQLDEATWVAIAAHARHTREMALIETRLEAAVAWIRQVVPIMQERGVHFPGLPTGITDTDPNGYQAIRSRPPT